MRGRKNDCLGAAVLANSATTCFSTLKALHGISPAVFPRLINHSESGSKYRRTALQNGAQNLLVAIVAGKTPILHLYSQAKYCRALGKKVA